MHRAHSSEKTYIVETYNLIKDIELPEILDCFDGPKEEYGLTEDSLKDIRNLKENLEKIIVGFDKKDEEYKEEELNALIGTYGKVNHQMEHLNLITLLSEYANNPSFEKVDHPTYEKLVKAGRAMEKAKVAWSLRHGNNRLDEYRDMVKEDKDRREAFNKKVKAFYVKNPKFNLEECEKTIDSLDKKISLCDEYMERFYSDKQKQKRESERREANKILEESTAKLKEFDRRNEKDKQFLDEIKGFEITVNEEMRKLFSMDLEIKQANQEIAEYVEASGNSRGKGFEKTLKEKIQNVKHMTAIRSKKARELGVSYLQHFVIKNEQVDEKELIRGEDYTPEQILEDLKNLRMSYETRVKNYYDRKALVNSNLDKAEETLERLNSPIGESYKKEKENLEKEKSEIEIKIWEFKELHKEFLEIQKGTANIGVKLKDVRENAPQTVAFRKEAHSSMKLFLSRAMDGKKPNHKDSPEFREMVEAIENNLSGLGNGNEEAFKTRIKEVKNAAKNYLDKKNQQFRPWESKQRKVRLEYAKSLVEMCDYLEKESDVTGAMAKEFEAYIKKGEQAKDQVVALQDVHTYNGILTGAMKQPPKVEPKTNRAIAPIDKEALIQI